MTTVKDLPEELLHLIFKEFHGVELLKLRLVCRTWHALAHILSFENVHLYSGEDVKMFIGTFDFHSRPRFLRSVKRITFNDLDAKDPHYTLAEEDLQKLLLRFPNLGTVEFNDSSRLLANFGLITSSIILTMCPRLTNFAVNIEEGDAEMYYNALCNARILVTSLDISPIRNKIKDNVPQFLAGFTRLSIIYGESDQLNTLEKYLPVLKQSPSVTEFSVNNATQDENEFAQHYLTNKTFTERLTKIATLNWSLRNGFSIPSVKFMADHLTGLQRLILHCSLQKEIHDEQQRLFCEITKNLLYTVNSCIVRLTIPLDNISYFLQYFTSNKTHQTLQLTLDTWFHIGEGIVLESNKNKSTQQIEVCINDNFTLQAAAATVFTQNRPLKSIEELVLKYKNRESAQNLTAEMYDRLIQEFPSLKKVTFDVPTSFQNTANDSNNRVIQHGGVESLVIQGIPNMQRLLDRCFFMFPVLKHLQLLHFCGRLNRMNDEFQVYLERYTLEKLVLDITPIRMFGNRERLLVLKVEILQTKQRAMFRVCGDILAITEVTDQDLRGFIPGADYRQISLTIGKLEHLVLELYDCDRSGERGGITYLQKKISKIVF